MMIAFITIKSSLVPLIEGLCHMELVTASGICDGHVRKKIASVSWQIFFQHRYRVGEGACEIFWSFFCVL